MKVIIAGTRNLSDGTAINRVGLAVRESGFAITEVVSGASGNVDLAGEAWARFHDIPVRRFLADWKKHGRAAGPIRNGEMADYADALIAVWDEQSPGTANMIYQAKERFLPVHIHRVRPPAGS